MAEWFEDAKFWEDLYPFMFTPRAFKRAQMQVESIIELTGLKSGAVLDLCSGPGRHTLEWAKKGFQVTGVDRTPYLMQIAMERSKKEDLEIEWVLEDMRNFLRPDGFDLIQSMFTSFGYFEKEGEDFQVLQHMHQSLKPEGKMVMDVVGKEIIARSFHDSGSELKEDGTLLVERRKIVDDWSRIQNEWILIKDGIAKTFRFPLNLYSGQELKRLFQDAGFSQVQLFGNLFGEPYDNDASRLVVLAQK